MNPAYMSFTRRNYLRLLNNSEKHQCLEVESFNHHPTSHATYLFRDLSAIYFHLHTADWVKRSVLGVIIITLSNAIYPGAL